MTPSKAILAGSGIIALSIVAAAMVLPESGTQTQKNAALPTQASTREASAPRYQIIKTEQGRTWRLDTETGLITVCQLQDSRLFCTDSSMATIMPKATPKQLEAERKEQRLEKREDRNEIFDRFMGFFDRIIKFAQKHAGDGKAEPEEKGFEKL